MRAPTRAELVTTMQVRDRVTGMIFGWQESDPEYIYVFPGLAEPGTRAIARDRIPVDDINPVTGVLAHPTFLASVSAYLSVAR